MRPIRLQNRQHLVAGIRLEAFLRVFDGRQVGIRDGDDPSVSQADLMDWRLVAHDDFYASLDELDDTDDTAAVAEVMILRVMSAPHCTVTIGDTTMRAIRNPAWKGCPALMLYYTAEDGVVTLMRLERDRVERPYD